MFVCFCDLLCDSVRFVNCLSACVLFCVRACVLCNDCVYVCLCFACNFLCDVVILLSVLCLCVYANVLCL